MAGTLVGAQSAVEVAVLVGLVSSGSMSGTSEIAQTASLRIGNQGRLGLKRLRNALALVQNDL
jgi:hypothetical protein